MNIRMSKLQPITKVLEFQWCLKAGTWSFSTQVLHIVSAINGVIQQTTFQESDRQRAGARHRWPEDVQEEEELSWPEIGGG